MQSVSSQDKRTIIQIVEEIYSKIQPILHPLDASDRTFVAIIKALISLNNEPTNPRQLAACIQKHGFTTLGGNTPYATVSGHISTHFTRVRKQLVPRPVLGKVSHPTMTKRLLYYLLDPDDILREHLSRYFPFNETSISRHSQRPISPPSSREGTPRSSYETASITENQMSVESPCQLIEETHIQSETGVSSPKEKFQYENFEKPSKNEFRFTDENENFESFTKQVTSAIQHEAANVEMDVTSTTVESSPSDKLLESATEPSTSATNILSGKKRRAENGERHELVSQCLPRPTPVYLTFPHYILPPRRPRNLSSPRVPLSPDIRMVKINGLEVFSTKIKVGETEVQILRRVDTNCVDKFSLIQIGERKPRSTDKRWITLEEAQTLAAKLNIEEKLGKFLDPRLFDYFDVDLDLPVPTGTCCGPLAGFAYWF
ncbi:25653_t:CDS:2, partial [Racocetra persica]